MLTRTGRILSALLILVASGCVVAVPEQAVVQTPPPAPPPPVEVIPVQPGPTYVWVPGHSEPRRGGYVWVEGHWRSR